MESFSEFIADGGPLASSEAVGSKVLRKRRIKADVLEEVM